MTDSITPPLELVQQWRAQAPRCRDGGIAREDWLMARAAQWGADQELEACCHYFTRDLRKRLAIELRSARRPKPPSLKEQALTALLHLDQGQHNERCLIIRRALEALPDD
jgi:hypothetical protein